MAEEDKIVGIHDSTAKGLLRALERVNQWTTTDKETGQELQRLSHKVERLEEKLDEFTKELKGEGIDGSFLTQLALLRQSSADAKAKLSTHETRFWGVLVGLLTLLGSQVLSWLFGRNHP